MKAMKNKLALVVVGSLLLTGCGLKGEESSWSPVASSGDSNESLIVTETARFSGLLSVNVVGELTDQEYLVGTQKAAGWYVGSYGKGARGTAWYYRPIVLNLGRVVDGMYWETVTNVSAHEVCHALTGAKHDHAHWECMSRVASPTYPDPGSGTASSAVAMRGGACAAGRVSEDSTRTKE